MKRSAIIIVLVVFFLAVSLASCRNAPSGLLGPGSVTFTDTDMGSGQLGGTVTIIRATDESRITHYVIYWGRGEGEKLSGEEAIGEVEVSAAVLTVEVPQNTVIPEGATHLLAFVKNGDAESKDCGSGLIEDLGSTVTITVEHSFTDVDSFDLTVTGSDLTTITQSYDGSSAQIVAEVADGTDRTFEVLAAIGASDPSAVLSQRNGYSRPDCGRAGEPKHYPRRAAGDENRDSGLLWRQPGCSNR